MTRRDRPDAARRRARGAAATARTACRPAPPAPAPSPPDAPSRRAPSSRAGRSRPSSWRGNRRRRAPDCGARAAAPRSRGDCSWACSNSSYCFCRARSRAAANSLQPPAYSRNPPGPRVDLGDPRHRAVEERPVVRDDGDPAREAVDEALQPVEAVEVEVVRRLVEEQQVEPRQQDRGQRGTRGLAAGERCRLLFERHRQAELGADRPRSHLEVGAAESEEPLERRGVGVRAPVRRVPLDRSLRLGDARSSREIGQQRLAGPAVVLLRQVADGQRGGRPLDDCPRPARRGRRRGGAASTCPPRWGRRGRAASAARASDRRGRERYGRRTSGRRLRVRLARTPPAETETRTGAATVAGGAKRSVCVSSSPSWEGAETPRSSYRPLGPCRGQTPPGYRVATESVHVQGQSQQRTWRMRT